ncbi:MAG: DUF481 domain-containing protein [Bacteriovoracaceae bacterium]
MRILLLLLLIPTLTFAQYSNESEVSSVVTGGNSKVETYLVKTLNKYLDGKNTHQLSGQYTYGESRDEVSAREWNANYKFDRVWTDHFGFYVGEVVEGYRFQGIKARYNSDAGLKYYFTKSEKRNIFTEVGYRYTIEDQYYSETAYENKGRVFVEINDKPNNNFSYRIWAEYLPNFSRSNDYLFIHEASLTSILTSRFSLKFAWKGIYDQEPVIEGNKNYDFTYTTSLVARFN